MTDRLEHRSVSDRYPSDRSASDAYPRAGSMRGDADASWTGRCTARGPSRGRHAHPGSAATGGVSPAVSALTHAANLLARVADLALAQARQVRLAAASPGEAPTVSDGRAAAWMATGVGAQLASCQILDLLTAPSPPPSSAPGRATGRTRGRGAARSAGEHDRSEPARGPTTEHGATGPAMVLEAAARALGACPIEQYPPGTSEVITLVAALLRTVPASDR